MQKEIKTHFGVIILVTFALLFVAFSLIFTKSFPSFSPLTYKFSKKAYLGLPTLKTFSSVEDFKSYLAKAGEVERGIGGEELLGLEEKI